MRIAAGILAALVLAASGFTLWLWQPWADDDQDAVDLSTLSDEFRGNACREIAGIAAALAEPEPAPLIFLRDLGRQVAGIRPPPRGFTDLARGGKDRVPGRGFLRRFDDGSSGQARHFAGIAVATTFGDAARIRLISIFVRDDPEDSPDGRLTDEGISFATQVLRGELALDQTPGWLLDHLCRRRP